LTGDPQWDFADALTSLAGFWPSLLVFTWPVPLVAALWLGFGRALRFRRRVLLAGVAGLLLAVGGFFLLLLRPESPDALWTGDDDPWGTLSVYGWFCSYSGALTFAVAAASGLGHALWRASRGSARP